MLDEFDLDELQDFIKGLGDLSDFEHCFLKTAIQARLDELVFPLVLDAL